MSDLMDVLADLADEQRHAVVVTRVGGGDEQ